MRPALCISLLLSGCTYDYLGAIGETAPAAEASASGAGASGGTGGIAVASATVGAGGGGDDRCADWYRPPGRDHCYALVLKEALDNPTTLPPGVSINTGTSMHWADAKSFCEILASMKGVAGGLVGFASASEPDHLDVAELAAIAAWIDSVPGSQQSWTSAHRSTEGFTWHDPLDKGSADSTQNPLLWDDTTCATAGAREGCCVMIEPGQGLLTTVGCNADKAMVCERAFDP